jgi:two-component system, sensor histidine kinase
MRPLQNIFDSDNERTISKLNDIYPINILVVDDNDSNLKLMAMQFRLQGFNVDIAQNGYHACELAAEKQYHLICMDIQMPVMNGIEASKRILASAKGIIPHIVAVSCNLFDVVTDECKKVGIKELLPKPLSNRKVRQLIILAGTIACSIDF